MTDLKAVACKNQGYYLGEKKAENGKDHWFRYIKTMDSYSEAVLISPEMARELLESEEASGLRKPVNSEVITAIAEDIKSGKYKTTSISFSGKLLDGRLVLQAVILNEESAIVFVAFNISDKLSFLFG